MATFVISGTAGKREVRSQFCPSSRVTCTNPSSVPTATKPGRTDEAARVLMFPYRAVLAWRSIASGG